MPINVSEFNAMKKKYGAKKGKQVYFASENKGSKAFKKGIKTATKEGHTAKNLKSLSKK